MKNENSSKRIEYIDAMRGFTMLLVVMTHVCGFGFGVILSDVTSYSKFFAEFRMPLFFFVSGFVLYKTTTVWSLGYTLSFLKKKIPVQLITPFVFMMANIWVRHISFGDAVFDYKKSGYWFTFTLMEYFFFYIVTNQVLDLTKAKGLLRDVVLLLSGIFMYCATIPTLMEKWPLDESMKGLLGVPVWGNYLFMVIGTLVRKHFEKFEKTLENTPLVMLSIIIYFCFNVWSEFFRPISSTGFNLLCSLSGLVLVFAFFRKNKETFRKECWVGSIMQYVGRRTLDIYLIHYFFVISNLDSVFPNFGELNSPFIEFVVSLILSITIIAACLVVSHVFRLSPTLAHLMFGARVEK